jgi:hypothetical protein
LFGAMRRGFDSLGDKVGSLALSTVDRRGFALADGNTGGTPPAPSTNTQWASLGRVPFPNAVPAAPGQFIDAPGDLSPVSKATIARLLGTPE